MTKRIILFVSALFLTATLVSAKTFYVNGALGNDENDGLSKAKPVKTIQYAVNLAKGSDQVVVEGEEEGDKIEYNECVNINAEKFGLKLTGENHPILDGDYSISSDSPERIFQWNGIYVDAVEVRISGFKIQNYQADDKEGLMSISGAGIFVANNALRCFANNNEITDCNFGIYVDGATHCAIEKNIIKDIAAIENEEKKIGGLGIVFMNSGMGLEENAIVGNVVNGAEVSGISFGETGKIADADNSVIRNNIIENCGESGLAIFDIEGIVKVENNVFTDNNSSLYIGGIPIDTWFGSNVFNGASGETEIYASEQYDGYLLFAIWQKNNNIFNKATFSAMNKDERKDEVIISKNGGFIRTDRDMAEEDAAGIHRVVELK